jgi:hypothetical protein
MTRCDQALALAREGFHVFPIAAGKKAPPLISDFPNQATTDDEQIREWWIRHPDANIGISTTRYGESEALLVVDVDNKGDKHGDHELLRLELEGREMPDTYRVDTPTGGWHLYYRVDAPVRQGADLLGRGVDVRSRGGYVVAAGSTVEHGAYRATGGRLEPAPQWVLDACGTSVRPQPEPSGHHPEGVDAGRAAARVRAYLADAPLALEGDGGDDTTFKIICRVKDLGVDADTAEELLSEHWNPRCAPPWSDEDLHTKVCNAYKYGAAPVGVAAPEVEFAAPLEEPPHTNGKLHPFAELNKEFAFVTAGGGVHILWETQDANGKPCIQHLDLGAFKAKMAPRTMTIGDKVKSIAELWLHSKDRREYDGLVFEPGRPREIRVSEEGDAHAV